MRPITLGFTYILGVEFYFVSFHTHFHATLQSHVPFSLSALNLYTIQYTPFPSSCCESMASFITYPDYQAASQLFVLAPLFLIPFLRILLATREREREREKIN